MAEYEPKRKGTDQKSAPINQVNYSRLTRVCPSLLIVSVVAFLIAYYLKNVNMTYLWAGAIGALGIIEVLLNPITEEDEEDGNA